MDVSPSKPVGYDGDAADGRGPSDPDPPRRFGVMAVRTDCRHYSSRSVTEGELVQRCRLGAAEEAPFSCPEDCLFFEPRPLDGGWSVGIAGT